MEFEAFRESYNEWCNNWTRKGHPDHMTFLHGKLEFIPDLAWPAISEKVLNSLDRFPRVKDIIALWYSWREQNSNQLIADAPEETPCLKCLSTGLLQYNFEQYGLTYNASAACGYCHNWKKHFSPKKWSKITTYKVEDVALEGWNLIPAPKPCSKETALAAMNEAGLPFENRNLPDPDRNIRKDKYKDDVPF